MTILGRICLLTRAIYFVFCLFSYCMMNNIFLSVYVCFCLNEVIEDLRNMPFHRIYSRHTTTPTNSCRTFVKYISCCQKQKQTNYRCVKLNLSVRHCVNSCGCDNCSVS